MLVLLGAFALLPLLLPWLVARIGARAFYVAALLPIAAFVYTATQTGAVLAGRIPYESFDWIPPLGIQLSMRLDTLSWVMALIVTGVGALVMLYCRWYFRGKTEGVGQFSAVLLAFAGAMYGLVVTDDLVVLVMFWEVTSVLSYLLIGFYNRRGASRRAALQALLVTTLGGLVMLIGVVLMVVETGTSSISRDPAVRADGAGRRCRARSDPGRRAQQVRHLPLPLLAARRDGRADAGERVPARRGDGEGRHLPDRPVRAGLRRITARGARSSSASGSSRCCSAAAGSAGVRPQAHPRLRHGESARLFDRGARIRHSAMPRSPAWRC